MFYEYLFPLYACLFIFSVLFIEVYFFRLLFCGYCFPHSIVFAYMTFLSLGCEFLEEKNMNIFHLVPQPPAQILTHEYKSSKEEIYIPFLVYYLFGESSSTLIIQFFWFTEDDLFLIHS